VATEKKYITLQLIVINIPIFLIYFLTIDWFQWTERACGTLQTHYQLLLWSMVLLSM